MKKLSILLLALTISGTSFAYRAKSEDLSQYQISNYEEQFKEMSVDFSEFGNISESPSLGYYNFIELVEDGKVVAYAGLTHVKSYNKHEALIAIISPEGTLLDFSLPEANDKHQNVNDKSWKASYIGKANGELEYDGLAGSTFMARSAYAELNNLLLTFNYKNDVIVK